MSDLSPIIIVLAIMQIGDTKKYMTTTKRSRRLCTHSFTARCATLLIWLLMSAVVIAAFIFNNGGVLVWVDKNPAVNYLLLSFSTFIYVGVGFLLLRLNFCDEVEQ